MLSKIRKFLSGDERSVKVKKNILLSFVLKGCSVLVSFLLVPLTLGYLNSYEYGIWLTLSSILMWINYFDIGLGNGLRNKLTEAIALGNKELAKTYISTTFFLLTLIVAVIYTLFFTAQIWLDWYAILKVSSDEIYNLNSLVSIVFLFFCLSFILRIVGIIYLSNQLSAANDILIFGGNLLSLLIIFILTKISEGDLSKVALAYSCAPLLVYIVAYPVTFCIKYPYMRPSFRSIKPAYSKDLIGLGAQFFVIQIAGLIIFSTSNILITRLFGVEYVTSYNIAFRYFSIITMVFSIVISPIWSAMTDAYTKKDYDWIKRIIGKMQRVWLILTVITLVMAIFSNNFYQLWVGTDIKIPFSLSLLMGLYVTISNWNNIYAYFVNGIGKIKLQLYCAIIISPLYIPLAMFLGRRFGLNGIISATCIILLPSGILLLLQYREVILKNKREFRL